ncbi:putative inactive receptor kinase At5g10020 isoform X2 [Castanea sativa]|uniref:putative inactive receptor kinase At5g10020 isoform X2 n=1 Tax=Castanea sativa TaxID=21020 RepID=UPI003F64F4F5
MNLSLTLLLLLLLLLLTLSLPPLLHSASDSELRSLLEFKKGIYNDPNRAVSSWNSTTVASLSANDCPSAWQGVSCEGGDGANSGNVTAIVLEGLALAGELKFHALTELKSLRTLSLAGNNFTGRVEPVLGTIATLQHLDLSSNSFYGPIPARINDLWGLNYLNFSQNNFTNGFPTGIRNLQQLKALDMHGNGLWGDIAELLSELRNVEFVDLSFNEFFGSISTNSSVISSLANTVRHLDLSHNNLSGGFLASDSVQLFRNLEVLDLGDNQITGELPSLSSMSRLRVLRLGRNQFSGSIQEELLESSVALEELDLSGNRFTGSLLGINSTSLISLNLSTNNLSGSLPTFVGQCVILDFSRNMISGDISIMQNWSSELRVLDLSSNKLSGTLPSVLGIYSTLSSVDLSLNELSGSIPSSFFTSLTLTSLNLSGNNFSGVLPSDIGNIPSLRLLNLARNNFSGQLPIELSKLTSLEYLDLSVNKFTGNIPDNLPSSLKVFNVSDNDLSGKIPENLKHFPQSSFAGNKDLNLSNGVPDHLHDQGKSEKCKGNIRLAIILASVGAAVMIVFVLVAYHKAHIKEFHGRSGFNDQNTGRDVKLGRFTRPSLFNFHRNVEPPPTSTSFSNDHLLTSNPRSLPGQTEFLTETVEHVLPEGVSATSATVNSNVLDHHPATSGRRSSPGSPLSSSPCFIEVSEQPVMLDVYSPDRFAGELFFLDTSLAFTAEDLSRAPAEVLGRSSHGTLYKATLDNGHMLTVKWLRVGLVKHKKELAREVKRIGSIRHPHIVPLRAYYWGPREQERLLLADYVRGDSLALHLYETTPRRYSPLSFSQRLKVATEVANCLLYLHDRGLPHGNLKPTNILLEGPDYTARLTDYGLHRLMTAAGIAEQILNLGALGYCAPELATAVKPVPSFKADVYALGVILMELLTRRSAGDIISGQSGAVDLTDWVRLCDQEGRRMDCVDRDIAGGEEPSNAMDELLGVSLRCILPVNERPNIRQIFDELCSISI